MTKNGSEPFSIKVAKIKAKIRSFLKAVNPRALRRAFKYQTSRAKNGHISVTKRLQGYVDGLTRLSENPEHGFIIRADEKSAERYGRSYLSVPLSEARFLETFTKSIGARHVLEVGTFRGFSTAFMARGLPEDGVVLTIDEDVRPESEAVRFWEALGVSKKIHQEHGEAKKVLARLVGDDPSLNFFDLIFIDADKENYRHYVTECMKLLKQGGSMLIDNTLWKGLVQYKKPYDNGAEHIQKFNSWLFETYGEQVSIVPAWDGLTLVVKK